jgi:hypothetical protein
VTEDEFDIAIGLSYIGPVGVDNIDTYFSVNFLKNTVSYVKDPNPVSQFINIWVPMLS